MKKLLVFVLGITSITSFAQQQTFEFFRWKAIDHPLTDWRNQQRVESNYSIPAQNVDAKGNTWQGFTTISGNTVLRKNTTEIQIPNFSQEKAGYNYSTYNVTVDEMDSKLVLRSGNKMIGNKYYFDSYVIIYDTLGQIRYVTAKELGHQDSTKMLMGVHAIGGKLLAVNTLNELFWQGATNAKIQGTNYNNSSLFSDKNNTLYYIYNYAPYTIYSFYSDGAFQQRLAGKKIKYYTYNEAAGSVIVYTADGIYELNGKTEQLISLPSSAQLLKSSSIRPLTVTKDNYKLDILLSKTGFNIKDGSNSTSYLFTGKPEIGKDSLDFQTYRVEENVNLQEDSTLVLSYTLSTNPTTSATHVYLFTYKNGVVSFHKHYDLSKLGLYNSTKAFYVEKAQTYLYLYSGRINSISQIKSDTILTQIPTRGQQCNVYAMSMVADKNYLWIANESDTGKCSIARLKHEAYYVRGTVFYDANTNGYKDQTEFPYSKLKLVAQPSGLQLFPDYDGNFAFKGEQGKTYTIHVVDSNRFSSIKKDSYYGGIGVKLKVETPEVHSSFWLPRARCFTNRPSNFTLNNVGIVAVEKVVIRLIPNKMKLLQDGMLVDTATFTYQNLGVQKQASIPYTIEWPEAELVGQTATLRTITDLYISGVVASRKIDSVQTIIRCSYDPNDKSVTPPGIGKEHYTLKNSALQYQIRFENTGNDTAYHVVIQDTLNTNLDLSTFKVIGSSHKVNTEVSSNGVVGFHFNYIMLPDTGVDKLGAQGYISFSVQPKKTVADHTLLCNRAGIYFDQNKPIITNNTCNLLVEKLPTIVTSLDRSPTTIESAIYPNPTSGLVNVPNGLEKIVLYNTLGEEVFISRESKFNVSTLEEGIYLAKAQFVNGTVNSYKLSIIK